MTRAAEPILVWGAGAIGGTIAAYLARAGHDVVLVDRDADHVNAVNRDGLRIDGPIEQFTARAPAVTPDAVSGRYGTVLLCVKAQHTLDAARALEPHLAADGVVVSAQNGLNETVIAGVAGEARTIGCFVNFGADYLEPGVVHYGGRGAVVVGELDGRLTPRLDALHRLLLDFEPNAVQTPNIWGYLWSKLAYGAQLFATAVTNEGIADALAASEHRELFADVAREVMRVAHARGIKPEAFNGFDPSAFEPGAPATAAEASLDALVAFNRRSAKTHSGIWRDLAVRKRKTEAEAQLGPIAAAGRASGVPTPIVTRLIAMIQEIERGERPLDWKNLDELEAARS